MTIDTGERLLQAHLFTPQEPNGNEELPGRAALFIHGYRSTSGSYLQYGKALAAQGVTSMAFDLGGHGESDGRLFDLSVEDNERDVQAAYDTLAAQVHVQPDRIGVAGTSYGAYLGARLLRRRPIKSLLLRVPAIYRDEMSQVPRRYFSTDDEMELPPFEDNQVLASVAAFAGKTVLVVSEHDKVINPEVTAGYAAALRDGTRIVMKGASHVLGPAGRKLFKSIILKWAAESL
jgi:esterase/lipase